MKKLLMILAILLLPLIAFGADLLVSWDANTEDDLAGYKVYYAPPSEWDGLTHNGSYPQMFDVGNVTTYTIPDIAEGAHGVTVTAYDTSGNESDGGDPASVFFNQVDLPVAPAPTASSSPAGLTIEVQ